jgi:hypothetical protein
MRRTYWFNSPRGFANEYCVGVATDARGRDLYKTEGYSRIPRKRALRELRDRGDEATQMFVAAYLNEVPQDRFELAHQIQRENTNV